MYEIAYGGLRTYTMSHATVVATIARLARQGIHATYRTTTWKDWQ